MIPLATYRLQFNSNFRFRDAIAILDYLRDLGISHVYASPILTSRVGSGHGYDVTDPTRIDSDLGGDEDFAAFQSTLEAHGMGLLLDIVPNHMAASPENRWWMDVLEYGPDSPFASYFDIDWKPPSRILENRLLLPFLGKVFADTLNDGDLHLRLQEGRFFIHYGDQRFPVAMNSYGEILASAGGDADCQLDADSPATQEWRGILTVAQSLAAVSGAPSQSAAERRTKFENMRDRLRQSIAATPQLAACIENALVSINGSPGDPTTLSKLERLLSRQHYRLAFWQTESEAINYRRFFSITDLVGVRVEDPAVFEATHELAIRLGVKSVSAGMRIDHIDGLRDPLGYLTRLREKLSSQGADPFLVVEKILERDEELPANWPVEGSTGYDFTSVVNRLLVDEKQMSAMVDVYSRWIGLQISFDDVVYDKKKLVMRTLLGVEMRALGRALTELARDDRYARELLPAELAGCLVEVTACLPVYRTYIQTLDVPEAAKQVIARAVESARARRSTLDGSYFDFVADVLSLATRDHVRPEQREARLAFVTRWQQFTGSIMAKGLEDTALYVYYPLASLNEVGGDLRGPGSAAEFHKFVIDRQTKWPNSMNATTTHDTKRSEDARARISVLSEMPDRWAGLLESWSHLNQQCASRVEGIPVPDRNEEYLLYQTLIGTWPLNEQGWATLVTRVQEYMIKAIREAKVHSGWSQPNDAYESALRSFVARILDRSNNSAFYDSFNQFQQCVGPYGMMNGLSQTLLKIICPGIPDCYQGSELWDFRLVDPDNRSAVDYQERRAALAALRDNEQTPERFLVSWQDGRVKLYVTKRALALRTRNPDLFLKGRYLPLDASGPQAHRIVAFAREHQGAWLISVVPRCIASVRAPITEAPSRYQFWKDTILRLPKGAPPKWVNQLGAKVTPAILVNAESLSLGEAFRDFPLALLQS